MITTLTLFDWLWIKHQGWWMKFNHESKIGHMKYSMTYMSISKPFMCVHGWKFMMMLMDIIAIFPNRDIQHSFVKNEQLLQSTREIFVIWIILPPTSLYHLVINDFLSTNTYPHLRPYPYLIVILNLTPQLATLHAIIFHPSFFLDKVSLHPKITIHLYISLLNFNLHLFLINIPSKTK